MARAQRPLESTGHGPRRVCPTRPPARFAAASSPVALAGALLLLGTLGCSMGGRPGLRDYLPAHPGDLWWFDGAPGVITVDGVDPRGPRERIRLLWRRPDGSTYRRQELERHENGLLYALTTGRGGRVTFDPPPCISPPADQRGFAVLSEMTVVDSAGVSRRFNREWEVVGRESFETPAGTFYGCLHLRESLRDLADHPLPEKVTDWWFAPGVGWVGYRSRREGEAVPEDAGGRLIGARIGRRRLGRLPPPPATSAVAR